MDIIVIKYQDGTFKSSPFRLRFGSFKVFRAKEKIINININGQKMDLTMRLSESGEAYFQKEIIVILINIGK
jgi:phosphatidate phosphatase LPIN